MPDGATPIAGTAPAGGRPRHEARRGRSARTRASRCGSTACTRRLAIVGSATAAKASALTFALDILVGIGR